jgi:hypothetical protein
MNNRVLVRTLSTGTLTVCLAVYVAAVGVKATVDGIADWAPYAWLWVVAGVAVIGLSSLIWSFSKPVPKLATGSGAPHNSLSASNSITKPPDRDPLPASGTVKWSPTGYAFGDMRARIRAIDNRYEVSFESTGESVGLLTSFRGGFSADHFRKGEVGWYATMEGALRAVWEVDC